MKRAIITGATGTIGTALIAALVKESIEVLVFVRENSRRVDNIISNPLVKLKFCSLPELEKVQNDTGKTYDVFYHFAWAGASGTGRNDMFLQNSNIKYALDAVMVAKRFGCKRFVFAGSQAEYGLVNGKLTSKTPTFPQMGYGYAKLCAGFMTREYAHQLGLEHIWTRVLSVYGPNDGMQTMVMSVIDKLHRGIVPELTKGEQIWDFLYSEDAARAFRLLGEKGKDGKIYVLGSGEGRPLAEYIELIRRTVAPNGKVDLGAVPYGKKQVMYLCADISEIEKDTGWKPEVSFAEGIYMTMKALYHECM